MAGRVTLVTGGTRGIGESISVTLKEAGYDVVANYAGNDEAAKAFTEKTGIPTVKFDVGDYDATNEGIAKVVAEKGNIEVLVNNAGITRDGFFHKMSRENWEDVIRVNLTSCYNTVHAVLAPMRNAGFGRIVNISSMNGQVGQIGQVNYSAAKAGMIGFTKSLAMETAAKGITVNCVAPGYVDTEMVRAVAPEVLEKIIAKIPVGRIGHAPDIARAVLFCVADEASYITGETFSINGGQYML